MSKYYKKTSLSSLSKEISEENGENNPLDRLMHNSSTLQHLVKVTAWILRWPRECSKLKTGGGSPGKGSKCKEITASEHQDALRFLIYFDQMRRLALKKSSLWVTKKVKMKLTHLNLEFKIVVLHGRIKNFPIKFGPNKEIPFLPCNRLAKINHKAPSPQDTQGH